MYEETTRVVRCDMREVARISERQGSARLLFAEELRAGRVSDDALDHPAVTSAVAARPVPPGPLRKLQRLAMKAGRLDFETHALRPLAQAREAVLGEHAAPPPRFIVPADEVPLAGAYDDEARGAADPQAFPAV